MNVVPLTSVWLAGKSDALTPASQLTLGVTVTGRFERPLRIASETWLSLAPDRKTPPVASAMRLACPVPLRLFAAPVLIAITRIPFATRAAVADTSVAPLHGSCPTASPNHTTMRDEPLRKPVAESVASVWSALSWHSGVSPPPVATQAFIPFWTSVVLPVIAWLSR